MMRIINIVGARPNFMKIAPLMREYAKHNRIEPLLVHTGQHYDEKMSDLFFRELSIPEPDINLEVGSGSHAVQTAEIMKAFEPVVLARAPRAVLVVGDVNSTIACGLVAVKLGVRLVHVEAGLDGLILNGHWLSGFTNIYHHVDLNVTPWVRFGRDNEVIVVFHDRTTIREASLEFYDKGVYP